MYERVGAPAQSQVATDVLPALQDALDEADIRPSAKQEIADAVSSRRVSIDFDAESVTVNADFEN